MKLSKNKIPKLLKSKYQSKRRYRKKKGKNNKSKHSKKNTRKHNKVTNIRQKTMKNNLKGGGEKEKQTLEEFNNKASKIIEKLNILPGKIKHLYKNDQSGLEIQTKKINKFTHEINAIKEDFKKTYSNSINQESYITKLK